jgi:cytoskeletal protein RodZ
VELAMPLDAGLSDFEPGPAEGPTPPRVPDVYSGADLGAALKAIREHKGLDLEALSETTRVRRVYLAALEAMQLDKLPSRPFVIGYIRAYAQALGIDADAAVGRFKAEEPVLDEALPEPVGVQDTRDPRLMAVVAGVIIIVAAIVAWNVAQRILSEQAPPPPTASGAASVKALAQTNAGPVSLGAPLPAPVESTTPPPYETPGLSKALNADGQPLEPGEVDETAAQPALAQSFTPQGAVYGAPSSQAGAIIIQALKPATLIIRSADGAVYFARPLAAGEAYRAPPIGALVVDVSEPSSFQVFIGGQSKGLLPGPTTPLSKIAG